MTAGVNLASSLNIQATLIGTHAVAAGAAAATVKKSFAMLPGSGTVDQADLMFVDQRTLTAAQTENLDMAGTLLSPLGATIAAAEVVMMYFEVISGQIVIGAASANGFFGPLNSTGTITLNAGDFVPLFSRNGWLVTAATADLLKVLAGAAGAVYEVIIVARSVAR